MAVCEKPEMANTNKTARHNMQQQMAEELIGGDGHLARLADQFLGWSRQTFLKLRLLEYRNRPKSLDYRNSP